MKKYLRIYFEFFRTCMSEAASFRIHFILVAIMDLIIYATTLASIDFIFDHVDQVGAWRREHFMFFTAYMLVLDHLHMTFFSEGFWEFPAKVQMGTYDFVLLKPVDTLFDTFFRHIRAGTLGNSVIIWGVMIHYGLEIGIDWWGWAVLPLLILLSLTLLLLLEILIISISFWTIQSFGLNMLRMQFQRLSRWPDFAYHYFARKFFTLVFPMLLVGSAPVRFLFDPAENWDLMVGMLGAIVVFYAFARWIWGKGLNVYESASS